MRIYQTFIGTFSLLLFFTSVVLAADREHPLEPVDLSSPKATLSSFVELCNDAHKVILDTNPAVARRDLDAKIDAGRILRCLDLSQVPEFRQVTAGKEAAVCLKEVLDRIDWSYRDAPDADDIADMEEPLIYWTIPHTSISFSRVIEGSRAGSYVFSSETVDGANKYYKKIKDLPYKKGSTENFLEWYLSEPGSLWLSSLVKKLPNFVRMRIGATAVWQWTAILLVLLLAAALMIMSYRSARVLMKRGAEKHPFLYGMSIVFPIFAMLVPLWVRMFIAEEIRIVGGMLAIITFTSNIIFLCALVVMILGLGTRATGIIIASPNIQPEGIDAQFIRLLARILSIVAAIIAFIEVGKYLGIPLTTLLAGAGVGGVAVALAAQDTLKNVFGSIMIFLDKPYRIGERINVQGYDGVVEEIGLRSTRIRMLTGHLTTIPNEKMAQCDIENIGRRPHIRRVMDIPLPLNIAPDKARRASEICEDILKDHEGQEGDRVPRIFLGEIKRDCMNLRIMYWYHPPLYWEFAAFGQKVNQKIIERFEAEGIPFALPTTLSLSAQE